MTDPQGPGLISPSTSPTLPEISCRVTRTLLFYTRESNHGSLGDLLAGLDLDEAYLMDTNNWVSHAFLQELYRRMIALLGDDNAVYNMTLSVDHTHALGLLERIARLIGNPKLLYSQAPKYNRMLKQNGEVVVHEIGDSWVVLEDRYHDPGQKTRYDCDYTRGVLAGIPILFGMPLARVQELTCQVLPEAYGQRTWPDAPNFDQRGCLYRVEWDQTKLPSFRRRIFARRKVYQQAIDDLNSANRAIQEKYDDVKRLLVELEAANQKLQQSQRQLELSTAELQASETKYRLLAENVTDIIWTANLADLKFTYVSPSVERMRGLTPAQAMAQSLEQTVSPLSHGEIMALLQQELALEGQAGVEPNRVRTLEVQQSHADGSYHWAEATVTFIRDEAGRPAGIVGVTRDISERKRAEQEHARMEDFLRQAQKLQALGTLAGGIAHDFNNIIGAIMGFAELAQELGREDLSNQEALEGILRSAERARNLVRQILTFGRKAEADLKPLDLNAVVHEVLRMLEQTLPRTVNIETDLAADLPRVSADAGQMQQVVVNLATNSADAMPAGGVIRITTGVVSVGSERSQPLGMSPGEYVRLEFSDTGQGMDQATQEKIFDPFFTTKEIGKGTGLGLSTVFGIIKGHGGQVYCTSQPGQGATFSIYLPVAARRARKEFAPLTISADIVKGNETVLIVDDEDDLRELSAEMLAMAGYQVLKAASGQEGLDIYAQQRDAIDLVVMDLSMPGMDGHQAMQKLLALSPEAKVIIASGYSAFGQQQACLEAGARSFLPKPYTRLELLATVKEVLLWH
ncbi:MAG: response regulator [Pseudomonadota bacterium]